MQRRQRVLLICQRANGCLLDAQPPSSTATAILASGCVYSPA
jgi:hypothetical protein